LFAKLAIKSCGSLIKTFLVLRLSINTCPGKNVSNGAAKVTISFALLAYIPSIYFY
jgi:hypothetical protein